MNPRATHEQAQDAAVRTLVESAENEVAAGELDAAIERLNHAPADALDAGTFRAFLERQRGHFEASERTLTHLLERHVDEPQLLLQRAYTRWMAGDLAAAAADFATIESRSNADAEPLRIRARADADGLRSQRLDLDPVARQLTMLTTIEWGSVLLLAGAVWLGWRATRAGR